MSQIKHKDLKADLQLKAIELLGCSINLPTASNSPGTNFNFDINLESRIDDTNKLVFVVVNVEIRDEDKSNIQGSLSISCVYHVLNFDEIIKLTSLGRFDIPRPLRGILNSMSVSTMRGVMYSTFKGTFLHNAFLPIIDPALLQEGTEES